jgi:hypothetical protein
VYPEILDDTINLIVPYHTEKERVDILAKAGLVFGQRSMKQIKVLSIKHPFNGWFIVFQVNL